MVLLLGLFGGLMGSFANVPIHRWPRGATVTEPRTSACPACGHELRWRDNIPVVSWLALRGRCRDCDVAIPARYPAVEAGMALLFGATAYAHPGWLLLALLPFVWVLVVAAVIDLEHRIIPNRLTYAAPGVLLAGLVAATALDAGTWGDLVRGLVAGIAVPLAMLALSEVFRLVRGVAGIGMGDIKLAVSIGLVVGYLGGYELVVWFYATAVSAVLVAVGLLLAGRASMASRIPYGPYLALGAVTAVVFGAPVGDAVAAWFGLA